MFKTIHDCRLELVAHTVMTSDTINVTMLRDDAGKGTDYKLISDQDADFMPCSAARASFGREDKTGNDPAADVKLMKYLADHKHLTPFEYQHATFLIEVPLFIRSQIMRHRVPFSYNEISRRYTSEDLEFWIPDKFRGQAKSNRQASSDEVITTYQPDGDALALHVGTMYATQCNDARLTYETLLEAGVSREQARAVLPQSLLTKFFMGSNLRGWANFIELRRDAHAQSEIRVVANRIHSELFKLWPESVKVLLGEP